MASAPTTKLQAINTILSSVGESPITSLDYISDSASATIASNILDEVDRSLQSRGWSFNTDIDKTLTRAGDNTISVGSDTIRVNISETAFPTIKLTLRGNKLYNAKTASYTFTSNLVGDVVTLLDFELLPEPARNYIVVRASRLFLVRTRPEEAQAKLVEVDEQLAFANLLEYEVRTGADSNFANYSTELDALGINQSVFLASPVDDKLKLIQASATNLTERQGRLYYQNRIQNKTTAVTDTFDTYRTQFNRLGLTEKEFLALDPLQKEEALVIAKGTTTTTDSRASTFNTTAIQTNLRKLGISFVDFLALEREKQQLLLDGAGGLDNVINPNVNLVEAFENADSVNKAINQVLRYLNIPPVSEIAGSDVAYTAKSLLNEIEKLVQTEGWHFNTEQNRILTIDSNNEILLSQLPYPVLSIDADKYLDYKHNIVVRGTKLWDVKKSTSLFSSSIRASVTLQVPWDSIPKQFQRYAIIRTAKELAVILKKLDIANALNVEEARARGEAVQYDSENADYSMFDSYDVSRVLDRSFGLASFATSSGESVSGSTGSTGSNNQTTIVQTAGTSVLDPLIFKLQPRQNSENKVNIASLGDSVSFQMPDEIALALMKSYGVGGRAFSALQYYPQNNTLGFGVSGNNADGTNNYNYWCTGLHYSVPANGTLSIGAFSQEAGANNGYVGFQRCNSFTLYTIGKSDGGTLKVQYSTDNVTWIDAPGLTSINTASDTTIGKVSATTSLTRGFYKFRVVGITGSSIVIGAKILDGGGQGFGFDSGAGIVHTNISMGGISYGQLSIVPSAIFTPIVQDLAIDHIILEGKEAIGDYEVKLNALINKFTTALPNITFTIVGSTDNVVNDTLMPQFRAIDKKIAGERGFFYFDKNEATGGWSFRVKNNWVSDGVHPSNEIHRIGAREWLTQTNFILNDDVFFKSTTNSNYNEVVLNDFREGKNIGLGVSTHKNNTSSLALGHYGLSSNWSISNLPLSEALDYNKGALRLAGGSTNTDAMLVITGGASQRKIKIGESRNLGTTAPEFLLVANDGNEPVVHIANTQVNQSFVTAPLLKVSKANASGTALARFEVYTDSISIPQPGTALKIKQGSNSTCGTGTLVAGTLTISNSLVTADCVILLTRQGINSSTTLGQLAVTTKTAGTSFVVTSLQNDGTTQTGDLSTFCWMIIQNA